MPLVARMDRDTLPTVGTDMPIGRSHTTSRESGHHLPTDSTFATAWDFGSWSLESRQLALVKKGHERTLIGA
jgi:hypothetical protein